MVGLDERKEGKQRRRKITLHSFRRFVKTVISDQTNTDYSEWFLGHNKSPYYTKKEPERREIYATKCMKYLTFLDYTTLETTGKNIEAKLSEKERGIQLLRQRDSMNTDAIAVLGSTFVVISPTSSPVISCIVFLASSNATWAASCQLLSELPTSSITSAMRVIMNTEKVNLLIKHYFIY